MNTQSPAKKQCYLCGALATTKDHIPPRGMFPKPRPSNLATVPACKNCNQQASKDDEYFRLIVAAISRDSPSSLRLLRQRILPRIRDAPALAASFLNATSHVTVSGPDGTGRRAHEVTFDTNRIQRVIERIVRGLFLTRTGERLRPNHVVTDFALNPELSDEMQRTLANLPLFLIGDGDIFSYRCALPDHSDTNSYWFLMFYDDSTLFVTHTSDTHST